jgi:hypothetical protein
VQSQLRRMLGELPGLPLCAVWVSFADELVLELGQLVKQHPALDREVGQWRLGALGSDWSLTRPGGGLLFPRPLADGERWGLAATRAFDPLLRARIESLRHGDDWRLQVRFDDGHLFTVEPAGCGDLPDWQLCPAGEGPYVEGGPGRRVALLAEHGAPPLEQRSEPLGQLD